MATASNSRVLRTIPLLIAICLVSTPAEAKYSGGTGKPHDPYQIATADDLMLLGDSPEDYDKHFILTDDIDLDPNRPGGQVFDGPVIGQSSSTPFEGALNGNGHNILNLTIDSNAASGLIGEVGSNGQVSNLGLLSVTISGSNVGSLAGTNKGSIWDCYAAGTVSGLFYSGGLVGENWGSVTGSYSICDVTGEMNAGVLIGCSRKGDISYCHATGSVKGDWDVGGLIGTISDTAVSECFATGSTSGNGNVGGLVGRSTFHSTVTYCYATGPVEGDHDVGGLVGNSWSSIGWCYATGSVSGAENVGGLIGFSLGLEEAYSCYFLKAEDGGAENGYGTALILSEIIQPASYVGWDFYGSSSDGLEDHWFMPPDSPPVLVWQTHITGLVEVPTVTGLTFDEAESALTNAGFIVGTVKHDYNRTIPADHVIWSKPAGYAVAGTIIDIGVSSGAYDWADNPGQGSSEEPYQISSASQLESLAGYPDLWDKHFILIDDVNMAGHTSQTALIAADSNSADDGFQGTPFTGSFDGNGFVIGHLTIELDAPSDFGFFQADLGLFGKIGPEGTVHRVRLENVQITTGLVGTQWNVGSIGALAAENEGTISDCSVTGYIVGRHRVGALVGINKGEIHSSYSANGIVVGDSDVGGLVGSNDEGTIANCYSTISVEADGDVGGLVGTSEEGTLRFCYAAGLITTEHDRNTGGLIGDESPRHKSTIISCFWDMETTGRLGSAGGVGLRTDEMKNANIYALNGWAGNSNWIIDDGKDYPRLTWEGTIGTPVPEPVVDWLEGTGTSDDPYLIATVEQLSQVAIASVLFDKQFLLVADIDLEGIEWRPISFSPRTEFDGVFDGNDHVVSNLNMIDPNGPQYSGMGLFGYTADEAIIRHLILKNIAVMGGDHSAHVGALVASNQGVVKDCHVEAILTGSNCGGLAGQNTGLVLYCSSTCHVTSDRRLQKVGCLVGDNGGGSVFASRAIGSITCGNDSCYIGGAVGDNRGDAAIVACSADVTVTCGDRAERVGGLVGFNLGTAVINSYATGSLNTGEQCEYIGGLVGENWSNVVNCYASGEIVTGDGTVSSGGLAGELGSSGEVTGSYFLVAADGGGPDNAIGTALSDAQMRQQASFVGWDFVGGNEDGTTDFWQMAEDGGYPVLTLFDGYDPPVLAGAGTVDAPYLLEAAEQLGFMARNPDAYYRLAADLDLAEIVWTTAVVPLFYSHFDGNGHIVRNLTIDGGSYIGLFGTISEHATIANLGILDADITGPETSEYVGVTAALNKGTIARCAVSGTVAGGQRVGGLAGENGGEITDCYATCGVTGVRHTGGLVGENNGVVTTSYVNGEVSSPSDEWGIGALVGYNYGGSLVNCFWEKRDGMLTASDLCRGLTRAQMMDGQVYGLNGWAGSPNWVIDSGNDYPRLAWEGTPGEPIATPAVSWFAGSGTPQAPYQIETFDQLELIGRTNTLWDKHFVLTADLDCSGRQFDRIGVCPGTGFSGDFDGTNHRLTNVTLGSDVARQRYVGLFGYIDPEGCVSRLIMENVSVSCGPLSGPVAALAAENQGKLVDCGAEGSLNCGHTCWSVGGLAGRTYGTVDSCYADMTINAGNRSQTIGGLAGSNQGHIINSYAIGSVSAGSAAGWVGGLAGITDGPLIHCYAAADISRKSAAASPYDDMGGLVADHFANSTIVSCYFLGLDNGLGTKLSKEQMKRQDSFVAWDFVGEAENGTEDVWDIREEMDYPKLAWQLRLSADHPDYDEWVEVGEPICWCHSRQCHGDADGKSQAKQKYWVSTNDLDILIAAWNKPLAEITGQRAHGVPLICADFDHKAQENYRVSTNDLDILIANWNKANKPDPNCP